MMIYRVLLAGVMATAVVLSSCSTSKGKGVDPFEVADEESEADMLDAPVKRGSSTRPRTRRARSDEGILVLPEPPKDKKKVIDGEVDDWSTRTARAFDSKSHVVDGEQFWDGGADASFRVGVDSDAGHVYVWVDVRDDTVIDAASEDVMADGIILWLRDPKLEEIVDSLPKGMAEKKNIHPEMAILFTPDGQFWRYDEKGGRLYRTGIDATTKKMKNGYRLEASLSLGVLGQVASLPTEDIAFRVELMDGDETDRRGEQTRMSMLPDEGGPRFALYNVGGWLPYEQAQGHPPRPGALGRWELADGTWSFQSFEVRPNHWLVLDDVSSFDSALGKSEALNELCPAATSSRVLLEAYESQSGRHRTGLVLCGPRAPGGRCPADATSHLYWVHLKPADQGWTLSEYTEASEKPLPQCARDPRPDGELYGEFSMLPMEMLGSSVWGIGFKRTYSSDVKQVEERGIWFVKPTSKEPFLGKAINERTHATRDQRTVSKTNVYLALVDDKKGLDLCEVERLEEQSCRGLNRSCTASDHSKVVRTHIKMWESGRFEPYLLTKHKRCNADFDFSKRRGFMLLNEAGRLGALASPAN
jgi:predicted small secreted protein